MSEITLTDQNFKSEVIESGTPVLVDFWAPWCGPCRVIAPAVEAIARDYGPRLKVGKLNVDDNPDVAQAYGVMSIPTLIVFKGGQQAERLVGAVPREVIEQALAPHVAAAAK